MKKIIFVVALVLLVPASLQAEVMPDQLLRTTTEKINLLLKVDRDVGPEDPRRLYALLDFCEQVLPHIDFRGMAKLVLGPSWRKASADQRMRFTHEFRNLLARIYGAALHKYRDQQIIYLPFLGKPGDKAAVVKTEVRQASGGPNIQINYSFYRVHAVWKVYDMTIDGVSLVTTYRSTYAELIRNAGIDSLIAGIAQSNRSPASAHDGTREPAGSPQKGVGR
ncbi:MAG: ABC transporter substrate-binding protein [Sulfuricaulis sp.]|nr:ABC transporter substrate-binding protein [Sulfuricaulis sp.]